MSRSPRQRGKRLIMRGPLLNFHMESFLILHPITGKAVQLYSAEHGFQAAKALVLKGKDNPQTQVEAYDYVLRAPTPRDAKERGRELDIVVPLWDMMAFGAMLHLHMAKFRQLEGPRKLLLETGKSRLVEHRPDPIWGDNMDGTGRNLCGKSLMLTRRAMRELVAK